LQVQRRFGDTTWDEAVEREAEFGLDGGEFAVEGGQERDETVLRRRAPLAGAVSVLRTPVPGPWRASRLRVVVANRCAGAPGTREDALPSALVAAHLIMSVSGGEFISMTDPPQWARAAVAECENIGTWPVLAGAKGSAQVMLSAPIILYDHPELAPQSPGELYDGTEIDEILTLRTLALSDAEKAEARATDPRAAALIDRVESMDPRTLAGLHGTMRRPGRPWWDPDAEAAVSPDTDTVVIGGRPVARGSRVRLRPGTRRADAQDMFLAGRIAEVQAVLHDVDDRPYLAVSLADDPDADLRIAHGRFLYFASDEVEPAS
jgi:hypothetical protein